MYCDKCNADGKGAKPNTEHKYKTGGIPCGGKFSLDKPTAKVEPEPQPTSGKGGFILRTKADPGQVARLALGSARAGTGGSVKDSPVTGKPVANGKVETAPVEQPKPTPKVQEPKSTPKVEPTTQPKQPTVGPEVQFNEEVRAFQIARAEARLEGADAELLAKLKRVDAALGPLDPGDELDKPRQLLAAAKKLLATAIASVPVPKVDPELEAFEEIRESAETVMREVEAVAHWPEDLQVLRDKLAQARDKYDQAVQGKEHALATKLAQLWKKLGTDLLAGKKSADEAGRKSYDNALKAIIPAVREAIVIRQRPDVPVDDATAARWDEARAEATRAKEEARWSDSLQWVAKLGTACEELRKASRDEAAFRAAQAEYQELKSGGDLEGAQTAILDRLERADNAVDDAVAAKAWTRAAQQIGQARIALAQAVASSADWRAYQEAAANLATLREQCDAVRSAVPCPVDGPTADRWDTALATHDDAVAEERWRDARDSLAEIEEVAGLLSQSESPMQQFEREERTLATILEEAAVFEGHAELDWATTNWLNAKQRVEQLKSAGRWEDATLALARLKTNSETLAHAGQALKAKDDATSLNGMLALTDRSGSRDGDYQAAMDAYRQYIEKYNANDFVEAKAQVLLSDEFAAKALAQIAAYQSYQAVATGPDKLATEQALAAAGANKASAASQDPFYDARSAWVAEHNAGNWAEATAAFRTLVTASKLVLDDVAFRVEHEVKATQDAIKAAAKELNYPPTTGTTAANKLTAFLNARDQLDAAVKDRNFKQAKLLVGPLKTAAQQLVTAMNAGGATGKKAFEDASKAAKLKVDAAVKAKTDAGTSIPALQATWAQFEAAQAVMKQAETDQKWVKAQAALVALEQLAQRLSDQAAEGTAFQLQYTDARQKTVADARAIAAENLPHLAAEGQAFSNLHRKVMSLIAAGRYAEAGTQLDEMNRLAQALIARNALLGSKDSPAGQRIRELLVQAQALKNRVVEPARDLGSAAAAAVSVPADACIGLLSSATPDAVEAAKELAKANTQFATAESNREKTWKDHYKVAGKRIQDARNASTGLDPKLNALREQAIAAGIAAIDKAVLKKHFGSATAKASQLIDEAEAWMHAGEAFTALDPEAEYVPQLAQLQPLVDRPGGAKVLDAMIAARMADDDGLSAQSVNVAMQARFGFKAQRFEQRRSTGTAATEEGNATPKAEAFTDKSVSKTYQVMAKVPKQHWSAQLAAMVVYDKNDDGKNLGGHFFRKGEERKVYMYCGRPEDAHNKQMFGSGQKILPDGEEVEDSCKPRDESPAPLFDFTLLHEAGHAEDDARGYMKANGGQADHGGWKVHAGPQEFAAEVAKHFGYDEAYILATLQSPNSTPPREPASMLSGGDAAKWERARTDSVAWCRSVREGAQLWENPALSTAAAIQGRVYQESTAGRWVSYDLAARARGISSYQFRSPAEWFAELYAAYFSKKLKDNHPSAKWLKTFKGATARA